MDDFVDMKHPNLPDTPPVRVARSSFRAWQKRGWVDAAAPVKQAEAPAPKPASRSAAHFAPDVKE